MECVCTCFKLKGLVCAVCCPFVLFFADCNNLSIFIKNLELCTSNVLGFLYTSCFKYSNLADDYAALRCVCHLYRNLIIICCTFSQSERNRSCDLIIFRSIQFYQIVTAHRKLFDNLYFTVGFPICSYAISCLSNISFVCKECSQCCFILSSFIILSSLIDRQCCAGKQFIIFINLGD